MDIDELSELARQAYASGKVDEAIDMQSRVIRIRQRDQDFQLQDHLRLSVYLTAAGQVGRARAFLDKIRHHAAGEFQYHINLGRMYMKQGELQRALAELLVARKLDSDQPSVNDSLAVVLGALDREEESIKCGEIALLLRSKTAAAMPAVCELPTEDPPPINTENPSENLVVFSIAKYSEATMESAITNALYCRVVYPGWRCRFYLPSDFPLDAQRKLIGTGAQIVQVAGRGRLKDPAFWSLHVLGDKKVKYFLMRDIRCQVNVRERLAVDDWLDTRRWFHVMRDHYSHTELILPGMWCGANGALPPITEMLKGFAPDLLSSGTHLTAFLGDRVWPTIRGSVCIHDRHHKAMRARSFPKHGDLPKGEFVGMFRRGMKVQEFLGVQANRRASDRENAALDAQEKREERTEELHTLTYSQDDIII